MATTTASASVTTTPDKPLPTRTGDDDDEDYIDDDGLDPRVKTELEILNQSASDVNCLEKEIDEARDKYQVTFSECSQQLDVLKKKFGASIKRARPYYELKEAARDAQSEALLAARKFQSANGVYLAAKETISLAELRLMDDKAASLSSAWQEMLNHAVLRVMEAEQVKSVNEKEHLKRSAVFAEMETKLHVLEKKQKRSIAKARSYFDTKKELELKLQQLKQTVHDLQQALQSAKLNYADALKRLEKISNGIHEKRHQKLLLMYPREPGVGAEENIDGSTIEQCLPTLSTSIDASQTDLHDGYDDDDDDDICDENFDDEDYDDIDNDSVFRAKVLTTALDDDDTSFIHSKGGGRQRGKRKVLKRTQSLPVYPRHRLNRCSEDESEKGSSVEEVFQQPLVPFSDRSENCPPDGDSLSSEKNIGIDSESLSSGNEAINGYDSMQGQTDESCALPHKESTKPASSVDDSHNKTDVISNNDSSEISLLSNKEHMQAHTTDPTECHFSRTKVAEDDKKVITTLVEQISVTSLSDAKPTGEQLTSATETTQPTFDLSGDTKDNSNECEERFCVKQAEEDSCSQISDTLQATSQIHDNDHTECAIESRDNSNDSDEEIQV